MGILVRMTCLINPSGWEVRRMTLSVFAACVVIASLTAPAVAQSKLDFTLKNDTGLVITELYVSPNTSDNWEEDVLGKDVLEHGASLDIAFSRTEKTCLWDLKIIDDEDDAVEWENLDLCKASHITLMYKGGKPTAIIK
jgi:hypothetical protein